MISNLRKEKNLAMDELGGKKCTKTGTEHRHCLVSFICGPFKCLRVETESIGWLPEVDWVMLPKGCRLQ